MENRKITFLAFFLMWAKYMRWQVPMLHVRICHWLETCDDPVRVLMVFRGAAKSTIYAVYKAWQLYNDGTWVSLIWAADGPLSKKLTRDTINVLRRHPLCGGMLPTKPGAQMFWVTGAIDPRNASMTAVGVNQNVTSARARDIDYDDVEVPKNIKTPEARESLRAKIQESTFILVPGGRETFIGTPHTHDSIYPEQVAAGAALLKIPLFESSIRYEDTSKRTRYAFPFEIGADGLYVVLGIHKHARMLKEGVDYHLDGMSVVFDVPPGGPVMDIYAKCAWPERFTREDVEKRRKKTRTLNYWDSQYMLEAKPINEVRLDPERIVPYSVEPEFRMANKVLTMWLGNIRIVSASAVWDPSSAKLNSDISSFSVVLQDDVGREYWHRSIALEGEVAEFDDRGKVIGGQVWQICDVIEELNLPRVIIETNGIGGNNPAILRGAFKARGITAGVSGEHESQNKNKRILDAFESLMSSNMLWAHTSVIDEIWDQMRDWNPAITNQTDDHLDSGSKALKSTPVRLGKIIGKQTASRREDWRPSGGVYEVSTDY